MATATSSPQTQASKSKAKANSVQEPLVTEKAAESLHHAIDALAARLTATEASLRDGAANSAEALSQKQREVEGKWNKSTVGQYVNKHPVASAGIAFAAGLILSSLFKRSE